MEHSQEKNSLHLIQMEMRPDLPHQGPPSTKIPVFPLFLNPFRSGKQVQKRYCTGKNQDLSESTAICYPSANDAEGPPVVSQQRREGV